MKRLTILLPVLLLAVAACGSDSSGSDEATIQLTGNLTYPQRIALVPGGVATVTLEDVSLADASSTVVAEQTIELGDQQVPIPVELNVDPSDLEPTGSYSVRASISGPDGSLIWTTDTANLIDPESTDDIDLGDIVLVQVGGDSQPSDGSTSTGDASGLVGGWTVTEIDGEAPVANTPATLSFGEDGSLSGNASCNSYTTSYSTDGDSLVLEQIASTMMLCEPNITDQEAAFLGILGDSPTFVLAENGSVLTIESASGSTLLAQR
ncbi:META domain-containing protein [Ilumatobacter sp.]|uniref:META domain-containing protein n=1 Tax=Ilumatobacter sp. TaxID=1967498 RepID=UPI003C3287DE